MTRKGGAERLVCPDGPRHSVIIVQSDRQVFLCRSSLLVFPTVAVLTCFPLPSCVVGLNNWRTKVPKGPKAVLVLWGNSHLCQELIVAFVWFFLLLLNAQTSVQYFLLHSHKKQPNKLKWLFSIVQHVYSGLCFFAIRVCVHTMHQNVPEASVAMATAVFWSYQLTSDDYDNKFMTRTSYDGSSWLIENVSGPFSSTFRLWFYS